MLRANRLTLISVASNLVNAWVSYNDEIINTLYD
jgi:hypothetical protein